MIFLHLEKLKRSIFGTEGAVFFFLFVRSLLSLHYKICGFNKGSDSSFCVKKETVHTSICEIDEGLLIIVVTSQLSLSIFVRSLSLIVHFDRVAC